MRICIFGDSIAWGMLDRERGGWADRFKHYLYESCDPKKSLFNEAFNLANPGDKTTDLLEFFENQCAARLKIYYKEANMVVIAIGTNDSTLWKNKKPRVSEEQFMENINKLIMIAKKYVNKIVFVGITPVDERYTTPIVWNKDAYYKNSQVEKYNLIIKKLCSDQKIYFIDIYPEWKKKEYFDLLYDGLHPNAKGHELLYNQIKKFLQENKLI